jgi:hypothetical protein
MATASARVPTEHASRYLQQLCKHWGHNNPMTFTPENGRIELPLGVCTLDADADGLGVQVEAAAEALERMEHVVAVHLQRFAFKEELQFNWVAN